MAHPHEDVNHSEEHVSTVMDVSGEDDDLPDEPESFWYIFWKIFPMSSQVFLCFFLTFIVYPGVCTQTHIHFVEKKDPAWNTLMFLTTFNIFDTVGRLVGG